MQWRKNVTDVFCVLLVQRGWKQRRLNELYFEWNAPPVTHGDTEPVRRQGRVLIGRRAARGGASEPRDWSASVKGAGSVRAQTVKIGKELALLRAGIKKRKKKEKGGTNETKQLLKKKKKKTHSRPGRKRKTRLEDERPVKQPVNARGKKGEKKNKKRKKKKKPKSPITSWKKVKCGFAADALLCGNLEAACFSWARTINKEWKRWSEVRLYLHQVLGKKRSPLPGLSPCFFIFFSSFLLFLLSLSASLCLSLSLSPPACSHRPAAGLLLLCATLHG